MAVLLLSGLASAATLGPSSFEVGAHAVDRVSNCLPNPPGLDCTPVSIVPSDDETLASDETSFDATASAVSSQATQFTTLAPDAMQSSIVVSGATNWQFYQVSEFVWQLVHPDARAVSAMHVDFTLSEPTSYLLTAEVALHGPFFGALASPAIVTLNGPSGVVAQISHYEAGPCLPPCDPTLGETLVKSGILAPGLYELEALVDATSAGYSAAIGTYGDGFDGSIELDLQLGGAPLPLGAAPLVAIVLGASGAAALRLRPHPGCA